MCSQGLNAALQYGLRMRQYVVAHGREARGLCPCMTDTYTYIFI